MYWNPFVFHCIGVVSPTFATFNMKYSVVDMNNMHKFENKTDNEIDR